MSTPGAASLSGGRINQKLRTRLALLRGARVVMERGDAVTIAAVAESAGISVATAYRYFSDPDTLAAEAILDLDLARSGDLLGEVSAALADIGNVEERVLTVHRMLFDFTRRNERAYRLFLAKTLEAQVRSDNPRAPVGRGGRRLPMMELALEPVRARLDTVRFGELVRALSAVTGAEAYIALKDVCGLTGSRIDRIAEANLRAVLGAALGPAR